MGAFVVRPALLAVACGGVGRNRPGEQGGQQVDDPRGRCIRQCGREGQEHDFYDGPCSMQPCMHAAVSKRMTRCSMPAMQASTSASRVPRERPLPEKRVSPRASSSPLCEGARTRGREGKITVTVPSASTQAQRQVSGGVCRRQAHRRGAGESQPPGWAVCGGRGPACGPRTGGKGGE